jgi:hypothetical protein
MNTPDELVQAVNELRNGTFIKTASLGGATNAALVIILIHGQFPGGQF